MSAIGGQRFVALLLLVYVITTAFFLLFIQHTSVRHLTTSHGAARSPLVLRSAQMRREREQQPTPPHQAPSARRRSRGRPLILFWTPLWGSFDAWTRFFSVQRLGNCRVRCAFSDQEQYLEQAMLVLFSASDVHRMPPPAPAARPSGQMWGLLALDPASATRRTLDLRQYDAIFNWTLSYRQDADVPLTYGRVVKLAQPLPEPRAPPDPVPRRALFRPQLCLTVSRREQFVHLLQKHMSVDVLGPCAHTDCGVYKPCYRAAAGMASNVSCEPAAECLSRLSLAGNYSFYLALEPLHCRDFVSARLHQALRHHLIPVVRGGADYARLAPPGSYIDAGQFAGPEALADHLLHMSEQQLSGYRRWWRTHQVTAASWACELCTRLHALLKNGTAVRAHGGEQLHQWWYQQSQCQRHPATQPTVTVKR